MLTDSWYRKIMENMIRISHLFGLNEFFFKECIEGYKFIYTDDDIQYFASLEKRYLPSEMNMLINTLAKGLNLKLDIINNHIIVDDSIIGTIENKSFSLSLKKIINKIDSQNRDLSSKPFAHLYLITLDEKDVNDCLSAINICRLGGLVSYFDYSKSMEASVQKAEMLNSLFIACVSDKIVTILNVQTGNEEQININELYPYIISYVKGKSKCSSCKDKED